MNIGYPNQNTCLKIVIVKDVDVTTALKTNKGEAENA